MQRKVNITKGHTKDASKIKTCDALYEEWALSVKWNADREGLLNARRMAGARGWVAALVRRSRELDPENDMQIRS